MSTLNLGDFNQIDFSVKYQLKKHIYLMFLTMQLTNFSPEF